MDVLRAMRFARGAHDAAQMRRLRALTRELRAIPFRRRPLIPKHIGRRRLAIRREQIHEPQRQKRALTQTHLGRGGWLIGDPLQEDRMRQPAAARLMDWLETEHAVRDVTTALAVGRNGAIMQATRARVTFSADSIRIDRLRGTGWEPWWRIPGPASHGVTLDVSNPIVQFGPFGLGWGVSNTRIVLRRGSQAETITTSRVGRVKHW